MAPRYLRAAALVVDAAGIQGWPHDLAGWHGAVPTWRKGSGLGDIPLLVAFWAGAPDA